MSKTNEELNELKKEVESVNEKLQELTEEEIAQVSGGVLNGFNHYGPPAIGRSGDECVATHERRSR